MTAPQFPQLLDGLRIVNQRTNPADSTWEDICDVEAGPNDSAYTYHFVSDIRVSRAREILAAAELIKSHESLLRTARAEAFEEAITEARAESDDNRSFYMMIDRLEKKAKAAREGEG